MRGLIAAVGASLLLAAAPAASAQAWHMSPLGRLGSDVRTEINRVRVGHGLTPLRASRPLHRAAAQHVYEMAVIGYFGHGSPNRPSFADRLATYYPPRGHRTWAVGETLLRWDAPLSARAIVQFWLNSPSHRRELLAPGYREVGISAVELEGAGGLYRGRTVTLVGADFGVRR